MCLLVSWGGVNTVIGCSFFFSLLFDFSNARFVRGQESLVALGRTEPMVHNTHGSLSLSRTEPFPL